MRRRAVSKKPTSALMESKICRVCLDRTATISLFDLHDNVQYREKILKCVSVTIEEGDGFPDSICENCASELSISYEFAQKCEASDRALRCLGLLQTPDLTEDFKTVMKFEPMPEELIPECADEALEYDDYDDHISESKYNLEIAPLITSENDNKKTRTLQDKYKRPLPNYLRKTKHRVYSGPIQCMICGKILKCQSAYEVHMRTHTKEKPFSCDLCKKNFPTKNSLKCHISRHYGASYKPTSNPDWDSRKKINRYKSPPVLCVICGLKVKCRSAMETHMRTHTGDKPFNCSECHKCYSLKGTLMKHIQVKHTKVRKTRFICEHCGKEFYAKSNIIVHLRIHTGEKPHACPFCEEKFAQASSLIRHKRCHTGEKPFKCQICAKAFRDRSLLNKHQSVHSEARDFVCHICSKALKTREALRAHIDRHNNPGKYICNFCGTTFSIKGNLNLHVQRIHSEKSGTCVECHKTVANLPAHMRSHSGEKLFICKLCNQRFMTQRSLSHHMGFKHRDAAKFKCSTGQCDKAFPLISMLEFHMLKAHLDTTPYVCQHCARGFLRPCDLSRHLRVNHMESTKIKSQFIKTVKTSPPT